LRHIWEKKKMAMVNGYCVPTDK